MRDFLGASFVMVGAILGLFGALFICAIAYEEIINRPACAEYGRISHQQTMFTLGTSCLVLRKDEWVDYKVAVGFKQEVTVKSK